jgi:uncharacterized membrane protein YgcG
MKISSINFIRWLLVALVAALTATSALSQVITDWKQSPQKIIIKIPVNKKFTYTIEVPTLNGARAARAVLCPNPLDTTSCIVNLKHDIRLHNLRKIVDAPQLQRISGAELMRVLTALDAYIDTYITSLLRTGTGDVSDPIDIGGYFWAGLGGRGGPVSSDGGNGGSGGGFNLGDWCVNNGGCDRGGDGAENIARITRGAVGSNGTATQSTRRYQSISNISP